MTEPAEKPSREEVREILRTNRIPVQPYDTLAYDPPLLVIPRWIRRAVEAVPV